MTELEIVKGEIDRAETFEALFGNLSGSRDEMSKTLRKQFAHLSRAVHPDFNRSEEKLAEDAFAELNHLYQLAGKHLEAGVWGKKLPIPGREKVIIDGKYERNKVLSIGDIADVHLGKHAGKTVLLKIGRFPGDNDLLSAEYANLAELRAKMASKGENGKMIMQCVPEIYASVMISQGAATKRRVNVAEVMPGFLTAQRVVRTMPDGVDGRTTVWMWKRMLLLLDWIYRCGYIHGAVLPQHVMFYPDNDGCNSRDMRKHAVRLIDWCYSIKHADRTRLSSWVPSYKDFYAPEIIAKKPMGPTTDLYMAAKTMIYLTGGDVVKGTIGKKIPQPIADSILACVKTDPSQRPKGAGDHLKAFLDIQKSVYGAPQWHDLNVPGGPDKTTQV